MDPGTFSVSLTVRDIAASTKTTGPEHLTFLDPDGNPILIDQHV
jgi:hypothetical protein